jgi:hypothetical protein
LAKTSARNKEAAMSDLHHERFDLGRFVLDFLEQQGSVVAPPAFGVYEVLLPEEMAARLGVEDSLHLRFDMEPTAGGVETALALSVHHPIVDKIANLVAQQPACAAGYINHVRLDKRGLVELAHKQVRLPNARLDLVPKMQERSEQHHYLQFNFKATILSEEKQEEVVSVMMDVQAGHAVSERRHLDLLTLVEPETRFSGFPLAPLRWGTGGEPLTAQALHELLLRAELSARASLAQRLTALAERMAHHLTLDLARLEEYYNELGADLRKRQARVDPAELARHQEFEDKLAMLKTEQRAKADDVRGRYGLRVELALVNTLLVAQPKVTLPVSISNRTTTIQRTIVWDPLMHRLEMLVCDVCGQPGESLQLCSGGHLVHEACLAPQCIDCKRVFCQQCAAAIKGCAVCGRPVCRHSLIDCPTCGRGTCREHQGLCHAVDGQPAAPPATPPARPATPPAPPAPPARPPAIGVRINVQIYEHKPVLSAFVMRSTKGVLATRIIELTPQGLYVLCQCEKTPCPVHGYYYRPAPLSQIDEQIGRMLLNLQKEYLVPERKVYYYAIDRNEEIRELRTLALPAPWHDSVRLLEATQGFARL